MTHEELRERLLDLAYGELSPRDARAVEEHAGSCESCRVELARIQGTRRLMARLPDEPAPEGGERILIAAAREAARGREPRRGLPRWLWAAPVVAASLAAAVALSLRLGAVRPPAAVREDPNSLLGESPYARAPTPTQAAPAAPPAAAPDEARAGARRETAREQREERPRIAEKRAAPASGRPAEPERPRYATAPAEAAPTPVAPSPHADLAAPTPMTAAPPPSAASPAPSAGLVAPAPGLAGAVPSPAAGARTSAEAAEAKGSAPAAARQVAKAASPPAASREEAAPAGAAAVSRYEELRRTGRLQADFRVFPACPREPWRRLERDPEGRIVSYAWERLAGGRRLRLEAIYAPDGSLARERAFDAGTGAPEPRATFRAPRASEVDLDAPTVCDR